MRMTTFLAALSVLAVLCCSADLLALPAYYQTFRRVEKPPAGSPLDKARCRTCHIKPAGGKGLNPYGLDFRKNGANEESLRKIEPLDSDGDSVINSAEISEGTLPGDGKSKP